MLKKLTAFTLVGLLLFGLFPLNPHEAKASTVSPKREFRAAWIATVANIDWPSKKGLSINQQKQEYIKLLDDVKAMGMNAVIVQIKPTADAFYPSEYGPWSEYLTGTQGKDPGYDPLAFMLEEAHKRNLEFHAWFNPYRITMNHKDLGKLSADHPAKKHPDWVLGYGNQLYYDPGIPEARTFIIESINEVVKKYDIDGVHMDDYFYPYTIKGQAFPDDASFKKYGGSQFKSKADWRRNNVNVLVRDLNAAIKKEKPYVKFGISPFGVWRNIADDPTGSKTKAGQTNYDSLFADTREWIQKGYIDYINPQIYWNIGFEAAAFDILLDWWRQEIKDKPIHLYIGQAAYKINNNDVKAWSNPEEYPRQIQMIRNRADVHGSVHFSLKDLNHNPLGVKDRLTNDLYQKQALIPTMPWLDATPPKQPIITNAKQLQNGVHLTIQDQPENDTAYYAIYRFAGTKKGNIQDPANLIATVRKTADTVVYIDQSAAKGTYTYVVTALDRLHNESKESETVTVP